MSLMEVFFPETEIISAWFALSNLTLPGHLEHGSILLKKVTSEGTACLYVQTSI